MDDEKEQFRRNTGSRRPKHGKNCTNARPKRGGLIEHGAILESVYPEAVDRDAKTLKATLEPIFHDN